MRWLLVLICLTTATSLARGQEQENKLVDRLLRPDMTLGNSAQNKKFAAVEGTSVDRKFVAKSFYAGEETSPKRFGGLRDFFARTFGGRKFSRSDTGSRPFLGQGTRQKILSQQDKPLSIDEVRELLNRNK